MSVQLGFDAGTTHIGVAMIDPFQNMARLWEITMNRIADTMLRIKSIQYILSDLQMILPASFNVVIENSAYSKQFRQTELAEIRTSAAFWFEQAGGKVKFIAPNTIRKQIFGKGNLKAHDVWTGIEPDALAALSCSYYI